MASYDLANRRVSGFAMYVAQNGAADAGRNELPTHSAWPSTIQAGTLSYQYQARPPIWPW